VNLVKSCTVAPALGQSLVTFAREADSVASGGGFAHVEDAEEAKGRYKSHFSTSVS
jgi:hypothetical protein